MPGGQTSGAKRHRPGARGGSGGFGVAGSCITAGALVRSGIVGSGVAGCGVLASVGGAVCGTVVANEVGLVDGKSDCIALKFGVGTIGGGTAVGRPDGFGIADGLGLAAGLVSSTAK